MPFDIAWVHSIFTSWWLRGALILAGTLVLLLFLFRIRYRFNWEGGLDFSAELDYGFPGFKRIWKFPSTGDSLKSKTSPTHSSSDASSTSPAETPFASGKNADENARPSRSFRLDPNRGQRALFLFITDAAVLRALIGYGFRCLRLAFRLLNLELNFALANSDPAQLGRLAGYWHATRPFLPTRRIHLEFHFEDRSPPLRLHARGGFSAAQALACLFAVIGSFPWFLIVRKTWRSWRNPGLSGWRARIFGWIRKAQRTGRNS